MSDSLGSLGRFLRDLLRRPTLRTVRIWVWHSLSCIFSNLWGNYLQAPILLSGCWILVINSGSSSCWSSAAVRASVKILHDWKGKMWNFPIEISHENSHITSQVRNFTCGIFRLQNYQTWKFTKFHMWKFHKQTFHMWNCQKHMCFECEKSYVLLELQKWDTWDIFSSGACIKIMLLLFPYARSIHTPNLYTPPQTCMHARPAINSIPV